MDLPYSDGYGSGVGGCSSVVMVMSIGGVWENGCDGEVEVVEMCNGTDTSSMRPLSFDMVRMSDREVCL